jgi:hypothetical protein
MAAAKDFTAELPQSQSAPLVKSLTESKWWIPFFDVLRVLGLKSRWIIYRRRRIVAEFERTLLRVQTTSAPAVPTDDVREDGGLQRSRQPRGDEPLIRRVAVESVQRMTEAELRLLNLPLGYVIDALLK